MRAGTLSDPRVVALLRKYFIAVEMTELNTRYLIENPNNVALLERLDREAGKRPPGRRHNLRAGEREVFLTPSGTIADIFLSLHEGDAKREWNGHTYAGLYDLAERSSPDGAVERFFDGAKRALERTHRGLPRDFRALRTGKAPEVAAVRDLAAELPGPDGAALALVVWVRADVVMYESLVGFEVVRFDRERARSMLPAGLDVGHAAEWPRSTFRQLLRAAYPRGAGVHVQLADHSIEGSIETRVTAAGAAEVRGTFSGSFELRPRTDSERSRRPSYRPWRWTEGDLTGDFVWDRRERRFTSFRLVSDGGRSSFKHGTPKTNP